MTEITLKRRLVRTFEVENFIDWVNTKFLYHTVWQIKEENLKIDLDLRDELIDKKKQMSRWAINILKPSFVYGFYRSESNQKIAVPSDKPSGIFENTCKCVLTDDKDYFIINISQNVHFKKDDIIAFQVVTLGNEAVEKANKLKDNKDYSDYFYWHGFCSALTEALAAKVHAMLRLEMGLEKKSEQSPEKDFRHEYPGKRYSFGYEALPDLMQQKKVLKQLNAERLGITYTESGMLEPEFSTCAMVLCPPS